MKPPAFQFYADDFLAGTMDMSPDELGIYIRLLCFQWNRGSLPGDPTRLARLAGGDVPEIVLEKFTPGEDGNLRNPRLESERQKQAEYRERQSQAGQRGGRPRKGSEKGSQSQPFPNGKGLEKGSLSKPLNQTKGEPKPTPKGSQSSPSPSPSPNTNTTRPKIRSRPKDLSECLAMADRIGWDHEAASQWYQDQEAAEWRDKDGALHGNWVRLMTGARDWARDRAARNNHRSGSQSQSNGERNGAASASVEIIKDTKALERCEARRSEIRNKYDMHMDWSPEDRKEDKRLREQIEILKRKLNFAA